MCAQADSQPPKWVFPIKKTRRLQRSCLVASRSRLAPSSLSVGALLNVAVSAWSWMNGSRTHLEFEERRRVVVAVRLGMH
jgi:hypothetical protein